MAGEQMVGLRHIVEDGIKILEGGMIAPQRREYVLSELKQMVEEARRGSQLVREHAWVVSPSERADFESFSIIDEYLESYASDELERSLSDATRSFELAEAGKIVPDEERQATLEFLRDLLRCIQHDGHGTALQRLDTRFAALD